MFLFGFAGRLQWRLLRAGFAAGESWMVTDMMKGEWEISMGRGVRGNFFVCRGFLEVSCGRKGMS